MKLESLIVIKYSLTTLIYSMSFATIISLFQKYAFSDFEYAKYLLILMLLDLITGITKAMKNKVAVTSYGLKRTCIKVIQYFAFVVTIHVVSHFEISGQSQDLFNWLPRVAYIYLILIEAKSIFENIHSMEFDIKWLIDVVEKFKNNQKNNSENY